MIPKLVFNKPLNPITVNNSNFRMYLERHRPVDSADGDAVGQWQDGDADAAGCAAAQHEYRYYAGYNSYVQDQDGNNLSAGWYYFTTSGGADTSGPTVTSVSPANTATAIPLNAQVIVHGQRADGSDQLEPELDPTAGSGSNPVAGTVSEPNNQELIFAPTTALTAGITYTVNVSGFTDANGNAVTPSSTTFTTGTAASGGGLSFTGSNITWGATVGSSTQPIILTFSQALDPSTVNSATLKVMNSWNSNIAIAGTYSVNGNQVTFTPTTPYPSGAQIYVGECGGPTDILGDVFHNGGCYGQQLVWFYAPAVVGYHGPASTFGLSAEWLYQCPPRSESFGDLQQVHQSV